MRHLFLASCILFTCYLCPSVESAEARSSQVQPNHLSAALSNGLDEGSAAEPRFIPEDLRLAGDCVPDGWDTSFTTNGTNGNVNAIVADGSGGYYIGGTFTSVHGVPAARIARWNGTAWTALGTGISGTVNAIAIAGGDVYVGGSFANAGGSPAKNIAKWNGSEWSALGAGLGGGTQVVSAISVLGSDVYIGGNFTVQGGSPASGLVRWDGASYSSVGSIVGQVKDLAVNDGSLYAGGFIAIETGGTSHGILKWDGTSWTTFGTSNNTNIVAIAFSGADMYVAGKVILPGIPDSTVARFDGTTWTPMQHFASPGYVNAIALVGSEIYVGGYIPTPSTYRNIARWNGSTWVGVSGGTDDIIHALAASGDKLVVGGRFTSAGGVGAKGIVEYESGSWNAFGGTGIDSAAFAIAVAGTDVYVGGNFVAAGPFTVKGIAKWDSVGNTWSSLGSGVSANGWIDDIAVEGSKVYAAGSFSSIGGVAANNIAVWNGANWAPLGSGTNARVFTIEIHGSDLYAGGSFQSAGGVSTNRIAKWNGTSWSGFGSAPIPNIVTDLAFSGNDMYVSSATNTAPNPNYLLKYDGTTWTGIAPGMGSHSVSSIAVLGTDIYVGGTFQTIGGISAGRVAKWNGSEWSALGSGMPVTTSHSAMNLAVVGTDLIAVGNFTLAGGNPANNVARWNGKEWSALGGGVDAYAGTVVSAGGDLFVGGDFIRAGCNASPYFARWRETVWTGSSGDDWHTPANWGSGSVPSVNAGVTIQSNDASITKADVTVSSLIVGGGRTLTIGAGRTLTVTRNLDLSNGNLTGPGNLVVDGDLTLHGGNVTDLGSIVVNGNLYLNGGKIIGTGAVEVTACRRGAIAGGDSNSFVSAPLTRCINDSGVFRFPVGTEQVYLPVDLSNVVGTAQFTVDQRSGPFSGPAAGLPTNRLQRWWQLTNGGVTKTDVKFAYSGSDVVGSEDQYRAYRIAEGSATLVPTSLDSVANHATVMGISTSSSWTLAEAESTSTADLTGRITTPSGRGAENVAVTLTDHRGVTRFGLTNPFGFYRFTNIPTFQFYTVSVRSKKFRFITSAMLVQVDEGIDGVDFVTIDH